MDYRRNSHPSCILEEIKEPELSGFIREFRLLVLCHRQNKPPAMQGVGRSLDIRNLP